MAIQSRRFGRCKLMPLLMPSKLLESHGPGEVWTVGCVLNARWPQWALLQSNENHVGHRGTLRINHVVHPVILLGSSGAGLVEMRWQTSRWKNRHWKDHRRCPHWHWRLHPRFEFSFHCLQDTTVTALVGDQRSERRTEQPWTRFLTYQCQKTSWFLRILCNLFAPFFFLLTPVLPSNAGPCRYAHCSPHSEGRSRCRRVFETGPHTLNIANQWPAACKINSNTFENSHFSVLLPFRRTQSR